MNHPDPSSILDAALGFVPKGAHLRDCAACGEEFERLQDRLRDLRGHYESLENPSTQMLEARVMRALRSVPASAPPRPLSARLAALVAASLVIGALIWWAIVTRQRTAELGVRPEPKPRPQEPAPGDVAARVNGEAVTWTQVAERLKGIKPSDVTDDLRRSMRAQLAEELLFHQFMDRKKIAVTDADVDALIEADVRAAGGRDVYERNVRLLYGTATKARESRRQDLLQQRVWAYLSQNEATDPELRGVGFIRGDAPEAELRAYYDSHLAAFQGVEKISFMRVGVLFASPEEEEKKRAMIESVRRRYEAGAEFAMLAFFYSDLRRAKDFRDLGVTRKDLEGFYTDETIVYLFETLKEQEVSPIIKDGKTLNLFKMDQKLLQKPLSYEEAKSQILRHFALEYKEENARKFRDLLRREARLEPPDLFGEPR
jgi:hypothetical protein